MRTRVKIVAASCRLCYLFPLTQNLNNMDKFIAHQIDLVETERKIDVEDTLKLLSAYAPIQLQRRGDALVGLKVTGLFPSSMPALTHVLTHTYM